MGERGSKPNFSGTGEGGRIRFPTERRSEIEMAIGQGLSDGAWSGIDRAMFDFQTWTRENLSPVVTKKKVAGSYVNSRKRFERRVQKAFELVVEQLGEPSVNDAISENWALRYLGIADKSAVEGRLIDVRDNLVELLHIGREAEPIDFEMPSIGEAKRRAVHAIATSVDGELEIVARKTLTGDLRPFERLIRELYLHPEQSDEAWSMWLYRAMYG